MMRGIIIVIEINDSIKNDHISHLCPNYMLMIDIMTVTVKRRKNCNPSNEVQRLHLVITEHKDTLKSSLEKTSVLAAPELALALTFMTTYYELRRKRLGRD